MLYFNSTTSQRPTRLHPEERFSPVLEIISIHEHLNTHVTLTLMYAGHLFSIIVLSVSVSVFLSV